MKTLNCQVFKLFLGSFFLACLTTTVHAVDLSKFPILPPTQTSIIGEGVGNAGVGDGTLFNATSLNPALLSQAPRTFEFLQLGLSLGNDIFGMKDYITAGDFPSASTSTFDNLITGSDAAKTSTLTTLRNFSNNMLNKNVQVGLSDNLSLKFDDVFGQGIYFGFQFYTNAHVVMQTKTGTALNALNNIPLPFNAASQTALDTITGNMKSSIQSAIDQSFTPAQQSYITSEITALKNGEDINTFKNNVQTTIQNNPGAFQGVSVNSLVNTLVANITNNLAGNIFTASALIYDDTVGMVTLSLNPIEDLPLTTGLNLKLVRRYFAWGAANVGDILTGNVSSLTDFENNLKQGTTRFGADLGFLYKLEDDINLGLSFQDLIATSATIPNLDPSNVLYNLTTDSAPTITSIGLSYHPIHELVINGDLNDVFSTTSLYSGYDYFSHIRLGTALTLAGIIQLRGGFANNNLAGGAGITLGIFGLDYSYAVDDLSQSYNHYAQLKLIF